MVASIAVKALKGLVKPGRKSKRGRKTNKVKLEEAISKKKNTKGAAVFPQKPKEKITYTKKQKKEIRQLQRAQERDTASEVGKSTAGGKRDSRGRLKSKHIPPTRKELSAAQVRRLVKQGSIKINNKGEVVNTGDYAVTPEEVMEVLYGRDGIISPQELKEVQALMGKKSGGKVYKNTVARKHGGPIGVGKALRGYGKGYK